MKATIKSEMNGKFPIGSDSWSLDQLDRFADALAAAVVTRVLADVQVLPGSFIAPAGGGPVTGIGVLS